MSKFQKVSIFRIFSANEWNQSEQIVLSNQVPSIVSILPILFSNAEKLRKIASIQTHINLPELFRIRRSIGLQILFSFIQKCFNVTILVQVTS
jgi:hypothetical protein